MANGTGITEHILAGLRAVGLRGRVIGNNLANLSTRNFRRSEVRFQNVLAKALEGAPDAELEGEVYQPKAWAVDEKGNDVDLDTEIGEMMRNSAQGRVYLRTLSKIYDQMEAAVRDRV